MAVERLAAPGTEKRLSEKCESKGIIRGFFSNGFLTGNGNPKRLSVDSRVMINPNFFWKMNSNYTRPCADLDMTRLNRSGHPPLPGYRLLRAQVKSDGVEPAELTEDDLLICCPSVLGFSFGEKKWEESTSQ